MKPVVIVGAGWSGACVADMLSSHDVPVEVLERAPVIGGHSRVEEICGVIYEPNGPHIFHTNNQRVADFIVRLGKARPYRFCPLTEIDLGDGDMRLMSWPIQVDELKDLPDWRRIERELAGLPSRPFGDDFETYAISLMGQRLYELFIEGYTRKQWDRPPSSLSSSFAPKRIELRRDGERDLFRRDRWQWFPPSGMNSALGDLLSASAVTCGADVSVSDLIDYDASAFVITAALDEFTSNIDTLEWRGIHTRASYSPVDIKATLTPAYVINRPSMSVPYTRTIETKHASGQRIGGTVVCEEYPGAALKHYPVADMYGKNARTNDYLQAAVRTVLDPVPVHFTGRLAEYTYINQDEAIERAWQCADDVLADLKERV